jgi:hypothetical protein
MVLAKGKIELGTAAAIKHADHLRLIRQATPGNKGWIDDSVQLKLTRGLTYTGNIDPFIANLVIDCDAPPLGALLMKLAQDMGGADPAAIAGPLAGIVRGLVTKGFLLPGHLA